MVRGRLRNRDWFLRGVGKNSSHSVFPQLRLGHDPCQLVWQVNESCERSEVCETLQDPCQLAWQVNESCERSDVCEITSRPLPACLAGERVL